MEALKNRHSGEKLSPRNRTASYPVHSRFPARTSYRQSSLRLQSRSQDEATHAPCQDEKGRRSDIRPHFHLKREMDASWISRWGSTRPTGRWLPENARLSSGCGSGIHQCRSGGGSPISWRPPALNTGTVAAAWPIRNILRWTGRKPLQFRVARDHIKGRVDMYTGAYER